MEEDLLTAPYHHAPVEILPGLFLGSEKNASSQRVLAHHRIRSIVNVGRECVPHFGPRKWRPIAPIHPKDDDLDLDLRQVREQQQQANANNDHSDHDHDEDEGQYPLSPLYNPLNIVSSSASPMSSSSSMASSMASPFFGASTSATASRRRPSSTAASSSSAMGRRRSSMGELLLLLDDCEEGFPSSPMVEQSASSLSLSSFSNSSSSSNDGNAIASSLARPATAPSSTPTTTTTTTTTTASRKSSLSRRLLIKTVPSSLQLLRGNGVGVDVGEEAVSGVTAKLARSTLTTDNDVEATLSSSSSSSPVSALSPLSTIADESTTQARSPVVAVAEDLSQFVEPEYLHCPWTHNQENIRVYFDQAFAFMDRGRRQCDARGDASDDAGDDAASGDASECCSVLVHCKQGVSRSASLVIAYVMKRERMRFQEAYDFVKHLSPSITPNMQLVYQLLEFERELVRTGVLAATAAAVATDQQQ